MTSYKSQLHVLYTTKGILAILTSAPTAAIEPEYTILQNEYKAVCS